MPDELRLYDARGTAATRLLRADLTLKSERYSHAAVPAACGSVIQKYAIVSGGD